MITSRELTKQTLEFASPNRIPRQLWLLPWGKEFFTPELLRIQSRFPDDICFSPGFLKDQPDTKGDPYAAGTYIDEWGCVFENQQNGIIGEVKKPIIKAWSDLSRLLPPNEMLSVQTDNVNGYCARTDKFIIAGCCPRPFERMQFLRGSENLFIDLMDGCSECARLLEMVHSYYVKELTIWAQTNVDGLMFMDDWGSQRSLLISPELWRKLFKPIYHDYINIAHRYGKYAFMHSDGYIMDILSDLIEIGLDAINCQLFCMKVEELGKRFKGKITFWGEIDRQNILPYGNAAEVFDAVNLVKEMLYSNGGVIAQCEFGPGAKPENISAVFEAWEKLH